MDDGQQVPGKAVIIATGAQYRKPTIPNISNFEGAGIYYAATAMERQLCGSEEVAVCRRRELRRPGCGVYLAGKVQPRPHPGARQRLADSMSRYLIRRIEGQPAHRSCGHIRKSWGSKAVVIWSASNGARRIAPTSRRETSATCS
jgi:thioredoxin reductase (NADPH)